MRPWVAGLARRGISAHAVGLPVGRAERAVPAYRAAVAAAGVALDQAIIGGQSYGGRVASLLATEEAPAGLALLCYPLHPPGKPAEARVDHWPQVGCPTLLLSGEVDPLARIDLLRGAVDSLPDATLFTFAGVGHTLAPVIEEALDRLARFVADVEGRPR